MQLFNLLNCFYYND